jgi:hypothetical protein
MPTCWGTQVQIMCCCLFLKACWSYTAKCSKSHAAEKLGGISVCHVFNSDSATSYADRAVVLLSSSDITQM